MSNKALTVLIIISVGLLSTSGLWFFHYLPKLRSVSTSNLAYAIEDRIYEFKTETGEYPRGDNSEILHQLRGDNSLKKRFVTSEDGFKIEGNQFIDEWGNAFRVSIDPEADPVTQVLSPGKNGVFGDDDDVDSSIVRQILIDRGETPTPRKPQE